jgi:Tfp pilus assembly protein PilZ
MKPRKERRSSGLLRVPFVQACRLQLPNGRALSGFVVNVNILGAYVSTEPGEFPVLGEPVVCRLRTPENDIEIALSGTVAWVNPHQQHPVHSLPSGFGIKFDSPLPDECRRRIQRIVDDYIQRRGIS